MRTRRIIGKPHPSCSHTPTLGTRGHGAVWGARWERRQAGSLNERRKDVNMLGYAVCELTGVPGHAQDKGCGQRLLKVGALAPQALGVEMPAVVALLCGPMGEFENNANTCKPQHRSKPGWQQRCC